MFTTRIRESVEFLFSLSRSLFSENWEFYMKITCWVENQILSTFFRKSTREMFLCKFIHFPLLPLLPKFSFFTARHHSRLLSRVSRVFRSLPVSGRRPRKGTGKTPSDILSLERHELNFLPKECNMIDFVKKIKINDVGEFHSLAHAQFIIWVCFPFSSPCSRGSRAHSDSLSIFLPFECI